MNARLNILVAEDSPDDVFFLQQAAKKAGTNCVLHPVSDGIEALAYLKGEGPYRDREVYPFPDILLLDLNMPGMNGFEVLEWIRNDSHCSRLIVHVLSASSRQTDIEKAYELAANSYLVKPSRLEELIAFVTALEQWHRFIMLPECAEQLRSGT